jgi:hypothetical protein
MIDSSVSQIIEDANKISSSINSIKDPSIEVFSDNFTKIDCQTTFSELEDILLSQSRDTYSQMSPADFFRIQDLYD